MPDYVMDVREQVILNLCEHAYVTLWRYIVCAPVYKCA